MGQARASRPVPGLVPLKYFPPLEAATAAELPLKCSKLACGACDSSRLERGVWGGSPPGKQKYEPFFVMLELGRG